MSPIYSVVVYSDVTTWYEVEAEDGEKAKALVVAGMKDPKANFVGETRRSSSERMEAFREPMA